MSWFIEPLCMRAAARWQACAVRVLCRIGSSMGSKFGLRQIPDYVWQLIQHADSYDRCRLSMDTQWSPPLQQWQRLNMLCAGCAAGLFMVGALCHCTISFAGSVGDGHSWLLS